VEQIKIKAQFAKNWSSKTILEEKLANLQKRGLIHKALSASH